VAAVLGVTFPFFSNVSAKAEPTTLFNWTGFYIGADAGGLVSECSLELVTGGPTIIGKPGSSALQYGGHIGYRYQFASNWVAGIEGQLWRLDGYYGIAPMTVIRPDSAILNIKGSYAVIGTLGYLIQPKILLYGAAGYSAMHYNACITNGIATPPCNPFTVVSGNDGGFTWGGGIALMVSSNLILRFQYLRTDYGTKINPTHLAAGSPLDTSLKTEAVTAGLSWKFGN
jgi:outer membrane immunogenic protein